MGWQRNLVLAAGGLAAVSVLRPGGRRAAWQMVELSAIPATAADLRRVEPVAFEALKGAFEKNKPAAEVSVSFRGDPFADFDIRAKPGALRVSPNMSIRPIRNVSFAAAWVRLAKELESAIYDMDNLSRSLREEVRDGSLTLIQALKQDARW